MGLSFFLSFFSFFLAGFLFLLGSSFCWVLLFVGFPFLLGSPFLCCSLERRPSVWVAPPRRGTGGGNALAERGRKEGREGGELGAQASLWADGPSFVDLG